MADKPVSIIDRVIVACLDAAEAGILEIRPWGWEGARAPCMSGTQGDLSSDKLPGARGQGESQPRGLGCQSDLESK